MPPAAARMQMTQYATICVRLTLCAPSSYCPPWVRCHRPMRNLLFVQSTWRQTSWLTAGTYCVPALLRYRVIHVFLPAVSAGGVPPFHAIDAGQVTVPDV